MKKYFLLLAITLALNYTIAQNSSVSTKIATVETVADLASIFKSCGDNVTTAIVLGYHEKNDGGGGIFVYNPLKSRVNDGGLIFNGWERSITDSAINVKWFGAISTTKNITTYTNASIKSAYKNIPSINSVNDLIDNNTKAFQKTLTKVLSQYRSHLLPGSSNRLNLSGVFIPSGEYLVKENIMDMSFPGNTLRVSGINYFSDGQAVLTFMYSGDNKYAFKNRDAGLGLSFYNIAFIGLHDQCNLFYSESKGGAQDYYFERCLFSGNFNKIFTLKGSNTNSEFGFMKCNFSGKVATILDISGENTSDQFLNYWFNQTKFWIQEGTIINADKGGHFKFVNCDWSGYSPSKETYYFKLNSPTSARGVNDFRIINGRFEMKNSNARVLKSNWQHGNIEINADFGSQVPIIGTNMKHFEFNIQGTDSCGFNSLNINFKNSVMMGYHEFNYKDNSWRGSGKILYENCAFPKRNTLDHFIKINHNSKNISGIGIIEIRDAIFENKKDSLDVYSLEVANINYFPLYSNSGLKLKYFKLAHPAKGGNPIKNQQFILNFPEEAESIITKVKWYLPKNKLKSSKIVNFTLTDINGIALKDKKGHIIQTDLVRMRDGFNLWQDVSINVKDLPEGKIVLKDNTGLSNKSTSDFLCIIEYF